MAIEQGVELELAAGLPSCVREVREKAGALVKAIDAPTFPDIEAEISTDADVRRCVEQASDWAREVSYSYGSVCEYATSDNGLCGLFGPDLTRAEERSHIPSLFSARDVLGELPGEFRESCVIAVIHMDPRKHARIRSHRTGKLLRCTIEDWPEIAEALQIGRTAITSKSLGLVMWVNERIGNLNRALVPTLTWDSDAPRSNSIWIVKRAGYARSVSLTERESRFVARLATGKPAAVHRAGFGTCMQKLPELRPWIRLVRSEASTGRDTESEYELPPEIASRIHAEDAKA